MKVQATKELLKLEYMKQIFKKDINYEATSHVDVFNSKLFILFKMQHSQQKNLINILNSMNKLITAESVRNITQEFLLNDELWKD